MVVLCQYESIICNDYYSCHYEIEAKENENETMRRPTTFNMLVRPKTSKKIQPSKLVTYETAN